VIFRVAQNEYTSQDNLIFGGTSNEGKFYSINSIDIRQDNYNYKDDEGKVFKAYFRTSEKYDRYERYSFTLFDMFGLLGGLYGISKIFGGLIVNRIADKFFMINILSNLYQVSGPDQKSTKVAPIATNTSQIASSQIMSRKIISKNKFRDNSIAFEESKNQNASIHKDIEEEI
jgi:hypothetical protein